MERWHGRVAVVTGASKGIGEVVAKTLAKHGMKVAVCARSVDLLQNLADSVKDMPGELLSIKCDLSKQNEILSMFSEIQTKWGGVDVCINNAGVCIDALIIDGDPEAWRTMLDVNVMALCLCTREAVTSMRTRGVDDGHVININSVGGHRVGKVHFYSATKFAVTALTEGIRRELREIKSKIKISEISPGLVKTHLQDDQMGGRNKALDMYDSKKHLQPDDIADVVEFLLSNPPHVQIHEIIVRNTEQET